MGDGSGHCLSMARGKTVSYVRALDEVDPSRDVHLGTDLIVLSDAVWQEPVDRKNLRFDSTSRQSSVQSDFRSIQGVFDLRHFLDDLFAGTRQTTLKFTKFEVAQNHHHRTQLILPLSKQRKTTNCTTKTAGV